jgi:hypothetical protein
MANSDHSWYRRSWVKYIWLYLVIAAVAYLAIYLIFFNDGGAAGGGGLY